MTRKIHEVPIDILTAEHYLFDLGYPIEKVSEVCDMDEETVRKIYDDHRKYTLPTRKIK